MRGPPFERAPLLVGACVYVVRALDAARQRMPQQDALAVVAREQTVLVADPEGVIGDLMDDDAIADAVGPSADQRRLERLGPHYQAGQGRSPLRERLGVELGSEGTPSPNGTAALAGRATNTVGYCCPTVMSLVHYRAPDQSLRIFPAVLGASRIWAYSKPRQSTTGPGGREEREAGGAGATLWGSAPGQGRRFKSW